MRFVVLLAGCLACTCGVALPALASDVRTVCTITVNSADEKEAIRRALPADRHRFVELVEHGRDDWLRSACERRIRCDALVVSGHYDGATFFFSDRIETSEYLPVEELERASCSESCPGLFSQLREVYLFGCNSLSPEAIRWSSQEIERSLVRSGHARADAQSVARNLATVHGESSRDRMRRIFKDVPVMYGFSSVAPLGPAAGSLLSRYFRDGGGAEFGRGRPSGKLLSYFSAHAMVAVRGATDRDADASHRADVCRFLDERSDAARKVALVHEVLRREPAQARLFLDRIERVVASLDVAARASTEVAAELDEIARDDVARTPFLAFARDADQPSVRARMATLAHRLGWLTEDGLRTEHLQLLRERFASPTLGPADVDLACSLNRDGALFPAPAGLATEGATVEQAAVLACLGDARARGEVLARLASGRESDVVVAQVYLGHRPLASPEEYRALATRIARMPASPAQARALDALAKHPLADRDSLARLAELFPDAKSIDVQRAIAGVLIRSDYRSIASPALVQTLRDHRLRSPDGQDVIDVLIRRLEAS